MIESLRRSRFRNRNRSTPSNQ